MPATATQGNLWQVGATVIPGGAGSADLYVATNGNDSNSGTVNAPFLTIAHAASVAKSSGEIIHVGAGIFVESNIISISPGVSVIGSGNNPANNSGGTEIQYNGGSSSPFFQLNSGSLITTPQTISYIKFNGNYQSAKRCMLIQRRSNVTIDHCTFVLFNYQGVTIGGYGHPLIDNVVISNCNFLENTNRLSNDNNGAGDLNIGYTTNCLVHDNYFNNNYNYLHDTLGYTGTGPNYNGSGPLDHGDQMNCLAGEYSPGNPLSAGNFGWKIYNNTFHRSPTDVSEWVFSMEFWRLYAECEIYNNTFDYGQIDLCGFAKSTAIGPGGSYGVSIHDNVFSVPSGTASHEGAGINTETGANDASLVGQEQDLYIYKNTFINYPNTVLFDFYYSNDGSYWFESGFDAHNINVYQNIFVDCGDANYASGGVSHVLQVITGNNAPKNITNNINFLNNTIYGGSNMMEPIAWKFDSSNSSVSNVSIANNIFYNIQHGQAIALFWNANGIINGLNIRNNDYFNCSAPLYTFNEGSRASGIDYTGNIKGNPNFVNNGSNFNLQTGSPCIGAGFDLGHGTDIGAIPYEPDTAYAGPDQNLTSGTTSTALTGSGTPYMGRIITGYSWTQVFGQPCKIVSPDSAMTDVTGLRYGNYQFALTVTDNHGSIGTDTVNVLVNSNIPPIANTGANQAITLPVNSATLTGSGSDVDGIVVNYLWTRISGPSAFNIVNPSYPVTDVTGLIAGVYQFQLQVTDNDGASGTALIQVTVSNAVNLPPVANAGTSQSITLPLNGVTLTGSGSDADGTVVDYLWTKISGPSFYEFVNASSPVTDVTGLAQGVYQFQLMVTDNNGGVGTGMVQVTVNNAINLPPVANAGVNQAIISPASSVTLTGSGSDPYGTIVNYLWTKISGPPSYQFVNASSPVTDVTSLVTGIYQFQLQVKDNLGAIGTNVMEVTVNAVATIPPQVNAGTNQSITLPANSVTLSGSASATEGSIINYLWTQVSGPSTYIFVNAASPLTDVTGLAEGVYQFQLQVTDDGGAVATDITGVIVNSGANIPPVANAGTEQAITLPANSVTLSGSGSDLDGTVAAYFWSEISGPTSATINNSNTPIALVSNLSQGVYQFQLQVTDNQGAIGIAIIQVTVNQAANIPPLANAGANQYVTLPVNSITLSGSGNDADGTVVGYLWTKISGPPSFNLVNATSPVTDVNGLTEGVYQFQLQVTDNNGSAGISVTQVTVYTKPDIPPVANAGTSQTLPAGTTSTTLTGSGTDADGTIAGYLWTQTAGSNVTISSPASPTTIVTGLSAGIYTFKLTVTDNQGATGTITLNITVKANIPPVANAGPSQILPSGTTTTTLSGNGTDADGSIIGYSWKQTSGTNAIINLPNSAITTVSGLSAGSFTFQLTVTDNLGAISTSEVIITVNSPVNGASLLNGLISYWPLDESAGVAIDVAGGDNNGAPNNVAQVAPGKINTAYAFNGTNSYVYMGNKANLSLTSSGSVSAWIYPTDVTHMGMIVSKGNPGSDLNGFNFGFNYNELYWELANATSHKDGGYPIAGNIVNNTWYLVTLTWNGSYVNLYLNGTAVTPPAAQTATPVSNLYPFRIGARGDYLGSTLFQGTIDEVGIWNRALSATEVATLYNSGTGITYNFGLNTPVAWAPSTPLITNALTTSVTAYPNPYSSIVLFHLKTSEAGRGSLVIYDVRGRKVASIFEGDLTVWDDRTVQYNFGVIPRQPLIYIFTIGDQVIHGKLMPGGY
jgi:hypothetical protein